MKKQTIASSRAGIPVAGFPVAVRAGHLLFMSGRAGIDPETGMLYVSSTKTISQLGLVAPDPAKKP